MEIDFIKLFRENPVLMVFSVMGMGLLLGKIRFGSIELGSTAGVLLIGLLFGHLGFGSDPLLATYGFTLFIFSVGLQAGPTFFSVFLSDSTRYISLAVVVAVSAVSVALLAGRFLNLEYGMAAGLLAGALTSTPTLAGAEDALRSGLASLPDGMTAREASRNVSVGYAITYVFGTIGLILFVRYFPSVLRVALPAEARKLAKERGFDKKQKLSEAASNIPVVRAYLVPEALVGKSIAEIRVADHKRALALRVRRGQEILEAADDLELEEGDIVSVISSLSEHEKIKEDIGEEILDPELLSYDVTTKEIVVLRDTANGVTINDLGVVADYGCYVRGLRRAGIDLPVGENVTVNKGDRLFVSGEISRLRELAAKIGRIESEIVQTDLVTYTLGVAAGCLLGMVALRLGGVSIGLGSAGGLLLVGILLGYLRSVYPTFGGVPPAARNILMEFGLMMFMAGVGLRAGGGIVEGFLAAGWKLIGAGVTVTILPIVIGYAFGRLALKLNPALLLGSLTGAMTSTPALNVITDAARSGIPALGYAGTYTFANVLLTFAGTLMMRL